MKIGIMSDLHVYNKIHNVIRALDAVRDADMLLLAGDLADRGEKKQYELLEKCVNDIVPTVPVFCVSGNHDNPSRNDADYRDFEARMHSRHGALTTEANESGAFKAAVSKELDLFGLNPIYHQKQFSFPNKGLQLSYIESELSASVAQLHIIMCHAPLIAHNPQRSPDMSPYFSIEQDRRLQDIVNRTGNVIFLSGHTHITPSVEFDSKYNNLYINDGSICPTTVKNGRGKTQQGNVTIMDLAGNSLLIEIRGIYTNEELYNKEFKFTIGI